MHKALCSLQLFIMISRPKSYKHNSFLIAEFLHKSNFKRFFAVRFRSTNHNIKLLKEFKNKMYSCVSVIEKNGWCFIFRWILIIQYFWNESAGSDVRDECTNLCSYQQRYGRNIIRLVWRRINKFVPSTPFSDIFWWSMCIPYKNSNAYGNIVSRVIAMLVSQLLSNMSDFPFLSLLIYIALFTTFFYFIFLFIFYYIFFLDVLDFLGRLKRKYPSWF